MLLLMKSYTPTSIFLAPLPGSVAELASITF
jgi:hypothetical protein